MFLIGAERVEGLNTEDPDDGAENVGLFEIDIDKFRSPVLHMFNCLANMGNFQLGRKKN